MRKMKAYNWIIPLLFLLGCNMAAFGQGPEQKITERDSLVYRQAPLVDSVLTGKSIFSMLPARAKGSAADVTIHQREAVTSLVEDYSQRNAGKQLSGYRVRIFFDNKQTARTSSEEALNKFLSGYHGIPAYRIYQNPFFKVTVGDFRTKSEAMELLRRIKVDFPAAFVVKEAINYPVLDKENSYFIDTVKVFTPVL